MKEIKSAIEFVPINKLKVENNCVILNTRPSIKLQPNFLTLLSSEERKSMESKVKKLLLRRPQLTRNLSAHSLQVNVRKQRMTERRQSTPKFSEEVVSSAVELKATDRQQFKDSNEFTFAKNKDKFNLLSERTKKTTSPNLINRIKNSKNKLKVPLGRNALRRFCQGKTILTSNEPTTHIRYPSLCQNENKGGKLVHNNRERRMTRMQSRCNSIIRFNPLYGEWRKSQADLPKGCLEWQRQDGINNYIGKDKGNIYCKRRVI